jgi:hypothetical protein
VVGLCRSSHVAAGKVISAFPDDDLFTPCLLAALRRKRGMNSLAGGVPRSFYRAASEGCGYTEKEPEDGA